MDRLRWAGSRDLITAASTSDASPRRSRSGLFLAASARCSTELRCQNPDCAAVLDVTATPVEYEAILQRLLYSPQAVALEPPLVPLDDFREAEKQGDNIEFALLVALACERATDSPLPLCDSCLEATLKAKSRAFHDACDDRDAIIHLRDMVSSRLQLTLSNSTGSSASSPQPPPVLDALRAATASLDEEEAALLADIAASEAKVAAAAVQQAVLDAKIVRLQALEARAWSEIKCMSRALRTARSRMLVR
jgi:hypothetical protein